MTTKKKRNMLVIELPREIHLEIKILAHRRNMSMKAYVLAAIGEAAKKDIRHD